MIFAHLVMLLRRILICPFQDNTHFRNKSAMICVHFNIRILAICCAQILIFLFLCMVFLAWYVM